MSRASEGAIQARRRGPTDLGIVFVSRSRPARGLPGPGRPPRRPRGPISSPEDARSRIAGAARHLREADASDPVPYLVVRSLRMGELYRSAGPIDPSRLSPPTSDDRQTLRRLANEGSWAELLEQAEQILARPEATGWLDARRLALRALAELGHEDAARAAHAVLGAELRDYPDWPRSELDDGTPCAGSEQGPGSKEDIPIRDATAAAQRRRRPSLDRCPTDLRRPLSASPAPTATGNPAPRTPGIRPRNSSERVGPRRRSRCWAGPPERRPPGASDSSGRSSRRNSAC